MKKAVLVCLAVAASIFAQSPDMRTSSGLHNGRWWKAQNVTSKLNFVVGVNDALLDMTITPSFDIKWKYNSKNWIVDETFPTGSTYSEIIDSLDLFYNDPANMRIPIISALDIVRLIHKGEPKETIDKCVEHMRSWASEDRRPTQKSKVEMQ